MKLPGLAYLWVKVEFEKLEDRVRTLDQIADVERGMRPTEVSYVGDGLLFIRIGDMGEYGYAELDLSNAVKIPVKHLEEVKPALIKKNDVLIAVTGATIGKVALVEEERKAIACPDIAIVRLREEADIEPRYLYAFLQSEYSQTQLKRCIHGSTNLHLDKEYIDKVLIPRPPKERRMEIANKFSEAEKKARELRKEALKILNENKRNFESFVAEEFRIKRK